MNQAATRGSGELDQTSARGSTALVDGVRWLGAMRTLHKDQAADYGVPEDEARQYVRLEVPKANYVRPWPGMWLRREDWGVLVPATLKRQADARKQARNDARYADVLGRLVELLEHEGPQTRNQVRAYTGTAGVLGAGDQTVRAIIERAVQDGALVERPGDGQVVLLYPAGEVVG